MRAAVDRGGCAPWKNSHGAVPWAAAGELAREQTQIVREPFFVVAAPDDSAHRRWVDSRGRHVNPRRLGQECARDLDRVGTLKSWPLTGASIGSVEQRHAPFNFTIVSIDPGIVLMTGTTDTSADYRWPDREHGNDDLLIDCLSNPLRPGTAAPFHPNVQWFSPDLGLGPATAPGGASATRRITFPRGELLLTHGRESWVVTRR